LKSSKRYLKDNKHYRKVITKWRKTYQLEDTDMNKIDYYSIIEAINELTRIGKKEIVCNLQTIVKHKKIAKPEKHSKKDDLFTSYFEVDLSEDDLNEIIDLFADLEITSLTADGEAGSKTNHYVSLLDRWSNVRFRITNLYQND